MRTRLVDWGGVPILRWVGDCIAVAQQPSVYENREGDRVYGACTASLKESVSVCCRLQTTAHRLYTKSRRAQEREGVQDGESVRICISMASRSQPVIWSERSSAAIRLLGKLYLFRNKPPQQGHACHGCKTWLQMPWIWSTKRGRGKGTADGAGSGLDERAWDHLA